MRGSTILILLGVLLLVGGVVALANPFAASLAVTTLVGMVLVFSGVLQLWVAIADPGVPHRGWTGLVALVALLAGGALISNPLEGVVSLTLLLGILFLITGAGRLAMSWRMRETPLFWILLLSGAASALIGLLVVGNIMAAATSLLGLLLGIELLVDGVALLALGMAARRL